MIELIIGLLSSLIPVIFELFSDKLDSNKPKPSRTVKDNITPLNEAEKDEDIATVFKSHDHRVRNLLREARAKRSKRPK